MITGITKTNLLTKYFSDLIFEEESHKYTSGDKVLTSVTQFISSFKAPFQTQQIAHQVAMAKGRKGLPSNPSYYKRYWYLKGLVARERGSLVHWFAGQIPNFDTPQTGLEEQVIKFYDDYIVGKEEIISSELVMYFGSLAGTADLITMKPDGTLRVWDYKTTTDLNKSYAKMLPPFEAYRDSALNTYSLQLALYKWIIESATEYKVSELSIVALEDDKYEVININEDVIDNMISLFVQHKTTNADKDATYGAGFGNNV